MAVATSVKISAFAAAFRESDRKLHAEEYRHEPSCFRTRTTLFKRSAQLRLPEERRSLPGTAKPEDPYSMNQPPAVLVGSFED